MGAFPDTKHFAMMNPEGWVQTLLDPDRFWLSEINGWALTMVESEFRETDRKGAHICTYSFYADGETQCEWFCRRFYAYQAARYRWQEYLLEKHCERALGEHGPGMPNGYVPQTTGEARASLIGWLSRQRGYATNPLVVEFRQAVRAKHSGLPDGERKAFRAERTYPSDRRYRITRSTPSRPDEMGWLILTWPIWNFYGWKWTHVAEALLKKFRFVSARGKRLDFLKASRRRLKKALRADLDDNHSMPAGEFFALFEKFLFHPSANEMEMHEDWERTVLSRCDDKALEKLCRAAANWLPIGKRPKGRATAQKPPLWEFLHRISA